MSKLLLFYMASIVAISLNGASTLAVASQNAHRSQFLRSQLQYLSSADSPSLNLGNGNMTVEAWFMATLASADSQDCVILSKAVAGDTAYQLSLENGGIIFGRIGNSVVAAGSLDDGIWHHVAMTYNQTTLRLYVDGKLVTTDTLTGQDGTSTGPLNIGRHPVGNQYFDGSIDEIRVWSVVRTEAEIGDCMFKQLNGTEANLRAYWKLNNSLADATSNGNTLTNDGVTFQTNDLPFFDSASQLANPVDRYTAGLWHMDGDSSDSSPNANHGSNANPQFGALFGKLGQGVRFANPDGGLVTANSYIEANLPVPDGGDFSIALWANFQNLGSNQQVFIQREQSGATGRPNCQFSATNSGLQFLCSGSADQQVDASVSLANNTWYHLVGTREGGVYRLYINGVNVATNTYGSASVCNPTSIGQIGRRYNGSYAGTQHPFNGWLDEILIEKRAMSAEEIRKYYGGIVRAEFKAATGDGFVRKSNANWSAARNASAADEVQAGAANGYASVGLESGTTFNLYLPYFPFDTASLPSADISINHATLRAFLGSDVSGSNGISVVQTSQGTWNALATTDFSLRGSVEGSARLTTRAPSAYNTWSFNAEGRGFIATGTNKNPISASHAGKTQLALRWGNDLDNAAPSSNDYAVVSMAESATPPILTVEYTAATSPSSGTISGTVTGMSGLGNVRVQAQSGGNTVVVNAGINGAYQIAGLVLNQSYVISAFQDANGNLALDPNERLGFYPANPLLLDTNKININIALLAPDSDNDGMNDAWEIANGLTVGANDASLDLDNDGLSNIQEYMLFGLNVNSANDDDIDNDGVKDGLEFNTYGTSPLLADSDGDGLPDAWEIAHGLDARRNDANEDRDFDFLTNAQEFAAGLNPATADSNNDGTTDYQQQNGGKTSWQAMYDRNDRLLGVRHERGASFAYGYDGNGNPVRQLKLGRDTDDDGLPDLWEFANGLDPKSGAGTDGLTADADGDNWTNYQEYVAGSDPKSALDKPGLNGNLIGTMQVPFTPTHFVLGAGQLDGGGTEEVIVGADGNPGANANFVRIYTEAGATWTHEEVSVGGYGITSIAIGQVTGRRPSVYLGLRKVGGTGRVVELTKSDAGIWQTSVIVESVGESAHVHGVRTTSAGADLMISLAPRFGPDGGLYRAAYEGGVWKTLVMNLSAGHRGVGSIIKATSVGGSDRLLRLVDGGGVQLIDPKTFTAVDEFGDAVIDPIVWSSGGSSVNGAWSATEAGGFAQLRATWGSTSGSNADVHIETTLSWPAVGSAVLVSIPAIGHQGSNAAANGSSWVRIGGTTIYSIGPRQTATNVLLHLLRIGGSIYYRSKVDTAAWSNWNSCPDSPTLRFQSAGNRTASGGSSSGLGAYMDVDYVRFVSPSMLMSSSSAGDYNDSEAAYHAASNVWYFRTPSPLSWLNAQVQAVERGGMLAGPDNAVTNSWLQGKFAGDFWMGYYRDFDASTWKWLNGSTSSFATWAPSQPSSATGQFFGCSNTGVWSSATGGESKIGVFEIKAGVPEVAATMETEPNAISKLAAGERQLRSGRFNSSNPSATSFVQVFIDDKDSSGTPSPADDFVISEKVIGAAIGSDHTVRTPLGNGSSFPTFGFATLRPNNGANDVLATGDPSGEVSIWMPTTNPLGPLQKKTLSLQHVGKAWHSMERVILPGSTQGLIGLRVSTVTPQSVDLIYWPASDLDFGAPPAIQQSAPTARLLSTPSSGGDHAQVAVKLWDSEGNPSSISVQYQYPLGAAWQNATLLTVDGQTAVPSPAVAAAPSGTSHMVVWNAATDLGAAFTSGGLLLRAAGSDFSQTGAWSDPMFYSVTLSDDVDNDGMPGLWESAHGLNPSVSDSLLDLDKDGIKNLMEFALDLDPQLPSQVGLPTISIENGYLTLTVTRNAESAARLTFNVQVSANLSAWMDGPSNVVVLTDTPALLKVRDNIQITSGARRFMRLEVRFN